VIPGRVPLKKLLVLRNNMSTEKTLESLIINSDSALKTVDKSTSLLFNEIYKSTQDMDFLLSKKHKELIYSIKINGDIYDSASFLQEHILNFSDETIIEIPLTNIDRDINNLNIIIQDVLTELNKNNKSFAYIVWRKRPEEYFYIGKAKSSSRLNLTSHGNLLESLKKATYFSMLFPKYASKDKISNLEAALMNLVEYKTDSIPRYNKRKETFFNNDYECYAKREEMADLFKNLSLKLK